MKHVTSLLLIGLLLPLAVAAQTFKYIGVEDGLSNRRISHIRKDSIGYMWFLTYEGVDRYDGKNVKHYNFVDEEGEFAYPLHVGWLQLDKDGRLWAVGKKGRLFYYDYRQDCFLLKYKLPESTAITYNYLDSSGRLWLCNHFSIHFYDVRTHETLTLPNVAKEDFVAIQEIGNNRFFAITESEIYCLQLQDGKLQLLAWEGLGEVQTQFSVLHYRQADEKVFIGTYGRGVLVYDLRQKTMTEVADELSHVNVTRIKNMDDKHLLVATEGMGVYQLNAQTYEARPFVENNAYGANAEINRTNINDIYLDERGRLWASYYPDGVVVIDKRYKNYRRMLPYDGTTRGLPNKQVHAVIEDEEGDLWFATGGGVSLYQPRTGLWRTFLSQHEVLSKDKNQIFLTLCEVSPGVVWAGGYTSSIYQIDKRSSTISHFEPSQLAQNRFRPDKYVRHIMKDMHGKIWVGGYYNLKRIDPVTGSVKHYPGISNVIALEEQDDRHLWVGTVSGLYLLDCQTDMFVNIDLKEEAAQINTLYQGKDSLLYIGTNGSGLVIYDFRNEKIKHYHKDNCAMVSNTINLILPERDGKLMMSTENGISCLDFSDQKFRNWTKEAGMDPSSFNISSGVMCKDGSFLFGSNEGVVEFLNDTQLPTYSYTPMLFTNFRVFYQEMQPDTEKSPLEVDINKAEVLRLKYSQNSFSFKVANINYDAQDNVLYYWAFDGENPVWARLPEDGTLRFTNLAWGQYKLSIRAVPKEEPYRNYEVRTLSIMVARPFWLSTWFIIAYVAIALFVFVAWYRFMAMRKQRKIDEERTAFFINTAHDIRTPLTLVKAPLEEILHGSSLDEEETAKLNMAMHNIGSLINMTTNLLNFEKTEVHTGKLHIAEYELNEYVEDTCQMFHAYAASRHVELHYESGVEKLMAWIDREKIDSIMKNVITNALKYTPEHGEVVVALYDDGTNWLLEVRDTGIGIPLKEQKRLFKRQYRASNAVNLKVLGSGMGLMLVQRLTKLHGGKVSLDSKEGEGTVVRLSFPKSKEELMQYVDNVAHTSTLPQDVIVRKDVPLVAGAKQQNTEVVNDSGQATKTRVLVVEDNDQLRKYIVASLSDSYNVQACENGEDALIVVKEFLPELVVSDIMMPKMRGDELCLAIKNDMETSHIPVLLLTALGGENDILKGLSTGADKYIVKPFSIDILRASIANLLHNRALLRKKYANAEHPEAKASEDCPNCATTLDWKFMGAVRRTINEHMADNDFTVDTLCAALNMSRTSFYNKLKALTGETPIDFIRNIRLSRSAELLQAGGMSITEVAEATGFCDGKYFREVFKKYYGVSPSGYAKGERKEKTS